MKSNPNTKQTAVPTNNKFVTLHNEEVFTKYAELKKFPKHSLCQYRSAYYTICDMLCGNDITDLTTDIILDSIEANPNKKNHINSIILDIYAHSMTEIDSDVILGLMDSRNYLIMKKLMNNRSGK